MAAMEVATARTRMARRAGAVTKYITELTNAIEERDLSTVEMRWINDVSGCLVCERDSFNKLSEVVLDDEDDEGLRETDTKSIADFKASVQEALSLATTCHSMKSLAIATQMLENNMTKLEQHFELEPEKNYAASLKLCCQLQDSLVVTIGTSCLKDTHPRQAAADKAMTTYLELTAKVNKPHKSEVKPKLSSETGLGGIRGGSGIQKMVRPGSGCGHSDSIDGAAAKGQNHPIYPILDYWCGLLWTLYLQRRQRKKRTQKDGRLHCCVRMLCHQSRAFGACIRSDHWNIFGSLEKIRIKKEQTQRSPF